MSHEVCKHGWSPKKGGAFCGHCGKKGQNNPLGKHSYDGVDLFEVTEKKVAGTWKADMDAMQSMVDYWKIRCSDLTAHLEEAKKECNQWRYLKDADRMEELEAQNDRLKEALEKITEWDDEYEKDGRVEIAKSALKLSNQGPGQPVDKLPCGHLPTDVNFGEEGTNYCVKCEKEARSNCLCKGGIRGKNCFDYHPKEERK